MQVPTWWLFISGLFFVVNAVFFVVLSIVLLKVLELSKDLKPKVERISDRLDSISGKVDDIASHVQTTVQNVGQKTSSTANSLEMIAQLGTANFGKYAPILAAIGTGVKAIQMIKQLGIRMPPSRKRIRTEKDA